MEIVRAGVFIGVDRTGNLPELHDAAAGARRMYEWALSQGIVEGTHAKLVTDAGGAVVDPDAIFDAIKKIIDGPGVDQLVVYYAGHGVHLNGGERWLLSEAPVKPWAVVNLLGSVELARRCGIPHVVIVSDACRTAPQGLQAQGITGVEIFPNDGGAGAASRPVDQFFATAHGRAAAEIETGQDTEDYASVYTDALLHALSGRQPDLLEHSDGDGFVYVPTRKLDGFLRHEVPRRIAERALNHLLGQQPDAIIVSDQSWLARLKPLVHAPAETPSPPSDMVAGDDGESLTRTGASIPHLDAILRMSGAVAAPFGPDHFETGCGIKVRGARIAGAHAVRADLALGHDKDALRVRPHGGQPANVLVSFDNHTGTIIPTFPGYVAAVSFDGDELVDVGQEPSSNNPRFPELSPDLAKARGMRAVAASSAVYGRFRVGEREAETIRRGAYDPALALYAAYAYHDRQETEPIRRLNAAVRAEFGVTLFDLALLSREPAGRTQAGLMPLCPMLSQGWALLSANRVRLTPGLEGVERTLHDSLWSLYSREGVAMLKRAMDSGEVA